MAYATNNERGKLTVQTVAETTPITTAEVKTALRIDHTQHDTYIGNLIKAATDYVESVCRLSLITRTYDLRLNDFPLGNIELPRGPVQSVTSITYIDINGTSQTLTETTNYHVDIYAEPPILEPEDTWPSTEQDAPNEVVIRYVAGYGDGITDVPERIRQVLIAIVVDMYEHPGLQTELVNGLHPNKNIDRMLWSFKRITIP